MGSGDAQEQHTKMEAETVQQKSTEPLQKNKMGPELDQQNKMEAEPINIASGDTQVKD